MTHKSELVFSTSDSTASRSIGVQLRSGRLRKLLPKVYTSNLRDRPEEIVRRNLWPILAALFPGALVSHRTALEFKPGQDGTVILTYKYTKKITLPGVTIRLIKGPKPTKDDQPFLGGDLYVSSSPRAYLENMQLSRARGTVSKSLSRDEIEKKLDGLCQHQGEKELNALRDNARRVSKLLAMEDEFERLNGIISQILHSRPAKGLKSDVAKARAKGSPYDPARVTIFSTLIAALKESTFPNRTAKTSSGFVRNISFFEAYFSNFIEGTVFEIDEAKEIVFENRIPVKRPKDAHDVLGTYQIVSSLNEMCRVPTSPKELHELLIERHLSLMGERPEVSPGQFKTIANRAGQTVFVAPDLVRGTLDRGYEMTQLLEHPLARAMFLMFVIAEVHPFDDGNGRIARIMMNAELVSRGLSRIIIPIVFRDDYLGALRALSRNKDPVPFVKMLDKAQEYTSRVDFSTFELAIETLTKSNAFKEPDEARLKLPPR